MAANNTSITIASVKHAHEGVMITHQVAKGLIVISSWYDSCIAIEEHVLTVDDFLKCLGLVLSDTARHPLSHKECEKIGGHCFEVDSMVVDTNPPIYHRVCKHCGLVQEGHPQPRMVWQDDTSQGE